MISRYLHKLLGFYEWLQHLTHGRRWHWREIEFLPPKRGLRSRKNIFFYRKSFYVDIIASKKCTVVSNNIMVGRNVPTWLCLGIFITFFFSGSCIIVLYSQFTATNYYNCASWHIRLNSSEMTTNPIFYKNYFYIRLNVIGKSIVESIGIKL